MRRRSTSERGVILAQVALMLVVLVGFSALVIDHGVMLVARAQAQNAADAGALAAATALAFDTMAYGDEATVQQAAVAVASSVGVWGSTPTLEAPWICDTVSADNNPSAVECPQILGFPEPPIRTYFGSTVRVYRNGEQGSTRLPTYFATLFGVTAQSARAQATAVVVPANTSTCVWPLAIPDGWSEASTPPNNTYVAHLYAGEPNLPTLDVYGGPPTYVSGSLVPAANGPTGIVVTTNDYPSNSLIVPELQFTDLMPTGGSPWLPIEDPKTGGRPLPVRVPRTSGGFAENLTSCNQVPVRIGDVLPVETASASFALVAGAASARVALDNGASWNAATYRVNGGCAAATPPCGISPRVVLLPVFDPDVYDATRGDAGGPTIRIVNFAGFFIESASGTVTGRLTTYPGFADTAFPIVQLDFSPLRAAILTR